MIDDAEELGKTGRDQGFRIPASFNCTRFRARLINRPLGDDVSSFFFPIHHVSHFSFFEKFQVSLFDFSNVSHSSNSSFRNFC